MDKSGDRIAQDAVNAFEEDPDLKKRSSVDAVKRALRQMDMFAQLNGRPDSEELISSVIGHLGYKSFKEGTSIYSEGLYGNRVYFILGGKVILCEKKSAGDVEREQNMLANSPTRKRQKRQEAEAQEFWDTAVRSPEKKKPEDLQLSQNGSQLNGEKQPQLSIKPMCQLAKFESFGNVSKEPTLYKNTAITETDAQLCFVVVSELDKKLQDVVVGIGSVTKVMELVLPNLRYEQAKRACYVPEYKIWSQGDKIFQENEPVKNYYFIKSGSVNIYKANVQSLLKNKVGTAARQPLSDQYLFKTLKPGDVFGLEEMFLSGQRYFTAECATPLTEIYEVKTGNNISGLPIDVETKRELKQKSKELLEIRLKELCAKVEESGYQISLTAKDVEIACSLKQLNAQKIVTKKSDSQQQQQPPLSQSSVASSKNSSYVRRKINRQSQPDLSSIPEKEAVPKIGLANLEQEPPSLNKIPRNLSLSQLPSLESSPRLKINRSSQIFDNNIKRQSSIQLSPNKKQPIEGQYALDKFQADTFEEKIISNRSINSPQKSLIIKRRGNSSVHVQSTAEIQRQLTSSSINESQVSNSDSIQLNLFKKLPSTTSFTRDESALSPVSYKKKQSFNIFSQDQSPIRLPPISDRIFSYKQDGSESFLSRINMSPSQPRFSPNSSVHSPSNVQKSQNLIKSSLQQLEFTNESEPKQLQQLQMLPISQRDAKPENFTKMRNPSNHGILSRLVMPHKCAKENHL